VRSSSGFGRGWVSGLCGTLGLRSGELRVWLGVGGGGRGIGEWL